MKNIVLFGANKDSGFKIGSSKMDLANVMIIASNNSVKPLSVLAQGTLTK
jgi:hypothetical protein